MQMKVLTGEASAMETGKVSVVQKYKKGSKGTRYEAKDRGEPASDSQKFKRMCSRCNTSHKYRECPAYGQKCHKCHGLNHYAVCCTDRLGRKSKNVQVVAQAWCESDESDEEFYVSAVTGTGSEWFSLVQIGDSLVTFKVDTGAQVNILNMSNFKCLRRKPTLLDKHVKLKTYNDEPVETVGVCVVQATVKGQKYNVQFIVVPKDRQSLIGAKDCERLGLVKRAPSVKAVHSVTEEEFTREKVLEKYKELFQGLGCLLGTAKIHLKENSTPVVYPARKVAVALKGRLKTELDRLEALGVIKKTTEPTEWVLPLVLVEKPNKEIRICMDPMDLNKCIKREHYHLPHKSEILGEMTNAEVFSKLDATQGFYQMQLDEESTHLCTVATPFGRYSFRRLPFGVSCAPEIFHAKVAQLFEQVQGVRVFMDDIVIWGSNREEHDN